MRLPLKQKNTRASSSERKSMDVKFSRQADWHYVLYRQLDTNAPVYSLPVTDVWNIAKI